MGSLVSLGIDELTLVLSVDKNRMAQEWEPGEKPKNAWELKAEKIINEFASRAGLEDIFGEKKEMEARHPQGYSVAYQYGDNPFYFTIAYHPGHPRMGIIVKFSAYSWAVYCKKTSTNLIRFLHTVKSDAYYMRLSRTDFVVDYQNWEISVDCIYHSLVVDGRLEIQNADGKKNHSAISGFEKNGKASTFYVGSRKEGSKLFLRIYDKKAEQEEKRGFRLQEALYTDSWVRFEAVFKGEYAHQLTDILIQTDEECLNYLIADKMAEKYRFYDLETKKYTDFTTALLERSKQEFPRLRLESTRDNDLICSMLHLINGSGLFSALYKCEQVWGEQAPGDLLENLYEIYNSTYTPNDDVKLWVKNHKAVLGKQKFDGEMGFLKKIVNFKDIGGEKNGK